MNRLLRLPTLALAALAFVFLATPVLAQAPTAGKYYEDNVDLGFKGGGVGGGVGGFEGEDAGDY